MFAAGLAVFHGIVAVARTWLGPVTPEVEISRSPLALPVYAGYSLLRIAAAYILSLVFTLVYGYVAAYNAKAERFMIPLLDVLQSIPVLGFLPGVMLAMVALFPDRQLGLELGSILLIFTGQVWNMAFSFYASLKSIPREMREAASCQAGLGCGRLPWGLGFRLGAGGIGRTVVSTASGVTARQVMLMQDLGTTVLTCTPSYALVLAEALKAEAVRQRLKLRVGFFGAEPWTEGMRRQIESGLGLEAFDVYGLTELGGPGVAGE